jgi:filamentous hemagglutinin family protein
MTSAFGWRRRSLLASVLVGLSTSASLARAGQITVDGRLSPAKTLMGPSYRISADLGKQIGSNLFHSFGAFSLSTGDTATFTGPNTVSNVVGRVTGGASSTIDGKITSQIPGANVFFVNPSGVVFGPNAKIDVSGSFHVTTADYIKMADGSRFQAKTPGGSTLTAAAPQAFGFLTPRPQPISVTGSTLAAPGSKVLSLVGGPVTVSGGTLQAPSGKVQIASAASTGEIPVDYRTGPSSTVTSYATVKINGSKITVDPNGAGQSGRIYIHGDTVSVGHNSEIAADNSSSGRGGKISLRGDAQVSLTTGAYVHADTKSTGPGGSIAIASGPVGAVTVDGSAVTAQAFNGANGNGGIIDMTAGLLTVSNGVQISADTAGAGNAGVIDLTAGRLTLSNVDQISAATFGAGNAGSVIVDVSGALTIDGPGKEFIELGADTASSGNGGNVSVTAGQLTLRNGGLMSASTFGAGDAGRVSVHVGGDLSIDGSSSGSLTGLFSNSNPGATGMAGHVGVTAGRIELQNGGQIGTSTYGPGGTGDVRVQVAGALSINGRPSGAGSQSSEVTGIFSTTRQNGGDGNVSVTAGQLELLNGGMILASTAGSGNAGSVTVDVSGALTIDGPGKEFVEIGAETKSSGNGGNVSVTAGGLTLRNGGQISASTFGSGGAGRVSVHVGGDLSIDGSASGPLTGIFSQGAAGRGGDVDVTASQLAVRNNGQISALAVGLGNAGNVAVGVSGALTIAGNAAAIGSGATASASGNGGNVSVTAVQLMVQNGGQIFTSDLGLGNAGAVDVSASNLYLTGGAAISTTAMEGNGGNVDLTIGHLALLRNSSITTRAGGNAGDIVLDPPYVVLADQSKVDAGANSGDGGNIQITAKQFIVSLDSSVQAKSDKAVNGNIVITAPANTVTVQLSELSGRLGAPPPVDPGCSSVAERSGSSSLTLGGATLPEDGGGMQPMPYFVGRATPSGPWAKPVSSTPGGAGAQLFLPASVAEGRPDQIACR